MKCPMPRHHSMPKSTSSGSLALSYQPYPIQAIPNIPMTTPYINMHVDILAVPYPTVWLGLAA